MATRQRTTRAPAGNSSRKPYRIQRFEDAVQVRFLGRLDSLVLGHRWWGDLHAVLRRELPGSITLDTSAVSFLDSAAYGHLRRLQKKLSALIPAVSITPGTALATLCHLRGEGQPDSRAVEPEEVQPAAPDQPKPSPTRIGRPPHSEGDTFVVDLDFERQCLAAEAVAEPADTAEPYRPLEFTRSATRGSAPAPGPEAASDRLSLKELSLISETSPAEDLAATASPLAPCTDKDTLGLSDSLKDRMLNALLEKDELRRVSDGYRESLHRLREERDQLLAQTQSLGSAGESTDALREFMAIGEGEKVWRQIKPVLDEIIFGVRGNARISPGKVLKIVSQLTTLADKAPLAAYGPVFPPDGEEGRLAASLGLQSAVAATAGLSPEDTKRYLLVCFFAEIFLSDTQGPGEFAQDLAVRLREFLRDSDGAREKIERDLALSLPVRRFLARVATRSEDVAGAVASLADDVDLAGREPLRLFLRAFGVWPRGSWLRLSDNSIAWVAAPTDGGLVLIRLVKEKSGMLRLVSPVPIVVEKGGENEILGPVRFSSAGATMKGDFVLEKDL